MCSREIVMKKMKMEQGARELIGRAFLRRQHLNSELNKGENYAAIWGTQGGEASIKPLR
jgi:hypothetical protein